MTEALAFAVSAPNAHGRRSVVVFEVEADGHRPVWSVHPKGRWAHVRHRTPLEAVLLEYLRAHWDVFPDAGWPMDTWFLVGCPECGADSFEPCASLVSPGRQNRRIHRRRDFWPDGLAPKERAG